MPAGVVKWFNKTKGYGFIKPDDADRDVFVHISAVEKAGMAELTEGQRVTFEIEKSRDGKTCAGSLRAA